MAFFLSYKMDLDPSSKGLWFKILMEITIRSLTERLCGLPTFLSSNIETRTTAIALLKLVVGCASVGLGYAIYRIYKHFTYPPAANSKTGSDEARLLKKIESTLAKLSKQTAPVQNQTVTVQPVVKSSEVNRLLPESVVKNDAGFFVMKMGPWTWQLPSDLSSLEIPEDEMKNINSITCAFLRSTIDPSCEVNVLKNGKNINGYQIYVDGKLISQIFLTNMSLQQIKGSSNVILCSRKLVGDGGQRKVRLCFDMMSQTHYIRKKLIDERELSIVNMLKDKPSRGVVPIIQIWKLKTSKGETRTKVLEPLCDNIIANLYGNPQLAEQKQKLSLIEDLLSGLSHLHKIHMTSSFQTLGSKNYKAFHGDITPRNILMHQSNGQWNAFITDFGCAGNLLFNPGGGTGNRAPDILKLYLRPNSVWEVVEYNIRYGQAKDVWAMGIICVAILSGKTPKTHEKRVLFSLPCIEEGILKSTCPVKDVHAAHLTQPQVDQDLAQFRTDSLGKAWDLVALMLRVNPDERITATEALARFKQAYSTV